jgi:hypothetical protein
VRESRTRWKLHPECGCGVSGARADRRQAFLISSPASDLSQLLKELGWLHPSAPFWQTSMSISRLVVKLNSPDGGGQGLELLLPWSALCTSRRLLKSFTCSSSSSCCCCCSRTRQPAEDPEKVCMGFAAHDQGLRRQYAVRKEYRATNKLCPAGRASNLRLRSCYLIWSVPLGRDKKA